MIMVHTSTETLLVKKLQKGKSSLFHALYVAVYNYVVINKYIYLRWRRDKWVESCKNGLQAVILCWLYIR